MSVAVEFRFLIEATPFFYPLSPNLRDPSYPIIQTLTPNVVQQWSRYLPHLTPLPPLSFPSLRKLIEPITAPPLPAHFSCLCHPFHFSPTYLTHSHTQNTHNVVLQVVDDDVSQGCCRVDDGHWSHEDPHGVHAQAVLQSKTGKCLQA